MLNAAIGFGMGCLITFIICGCIVGKIQADYEKRLDNMVKCVEYWKLQKYRE